MKEAYLYEKMEQNKVRCNTCMHRCLIAPGKRGICGIRENIDGKEYLLTYGSSCAENIDPIEKKPLYHFFPGTMIYSFATVGCNLRCSWCQNWDISQSPKPAKPVLGKFISPEEHVKRALNLGCPAIAYTYSEPTVFLEYALDTMKVARENGLRNVWVSNGYMTKETLELILPFLDAVNIDYKGPDGGVYETYCGGKNGPVLENLKTLKEAGVHIEITTLIIPGVNDQSEQLKEVADTISSELGTDIPWHVTRFFPAWKMPDAQITPLRTLEAAKEFGQKAGIKYIHIGNV
jgi:pyruvate formate lyase activating enzyme